MYPTIELAVSVTAYASIIIGIMRPRVVATERKIDNFSEAEASAFAGMDVKDSYNALKECNKRSVWTCVQAVALLWVASIWYVAACPAYTAHPNLYAICLLGYGALLGLVVYTITTYFTYSRAYIKVAVQCISVVKSAVALNEMKMRHIPDVI